MGEEIMNFTSDLYQPKRLEEVASLLKNRLSEYLTLLHNKDCDIKFPIPNAKELEEEIQHFLNDCEAKKYEWFHSQEWIITHLLKNSRALHSPNYIGHQVAAPIPFAAIWDGVSGVINQGAAVYEMGPFVLAAERAIVKRLSKYISDSVEFEGVVTHGGTLANLTALLAARNIKVEASFSKGINLDSLAGKKLAILTSSETHYSISRAAAVLGIGQDQVIKIPVHKHNRKIVEEELEKIYQQKTQEGLHIFALIGSACSTPTGAIDPLRSMGEFSQKHNLWFHVDAAHGGGLLLSSQLRPLFDGIELADSIVWDAHKMMFVPALCTFVFYKNKAHSFQAFSQEAPYLFGDNEQLYDYESGLRTFECTKGSLVLPLLSVLSTVGEKGIGELNELLVANTKEFARIISETEDFEVYHQPEVNILVFGLKDQQNVIHDRIRAELLNEGTFYITSTLIDGRRGFRLTVMNPLTTTDNLKQLLKRISYGSNLPTL